MDSRISSILGNPVKIKYIAWYPEGDCYLNLSGNYKYLELPYYISQDFEKLSLKIFPTCEEMLDAYVTPIFLEKAKYHQLPIPDFYISNGYFEPPVIIDPVNPFMIRGRIVLKPGKEETIGKSMTRNHTYAICCQDIPPGGRIMHFRSVLGWCVSPQLREISSLIWQIFHIPLARIRLIRRADGTYLFSDLSPLALENLNHRERKHLEACVKWVR